MADFHAVSQWDGGGEVLQRVNVFTLFAGSAVYKHTCL